jgi:hypothetical protein
MSRASVTQLDHHRQSTQRHPDGKRLQALSGRVKNFLPGLLDGFFSAADDFLFKLAEKGGENSSDYFDQLRVLRRQRVELRANIITLVDEWLAQGAQELNTAKEEVEQSEDAPKFSLMDDISLDRTLATDSFSTRTIERAGDDWLAFHERMMALTCQKKLTDKNTPFNPTSLGTIVLNQIESMDGPFKTALMLFRLFDDLAIPQMLTFYKNSNNWLIEEGILPNLKLLQAQRSSHTPVNAETIAQISANLAGVNQTSMPSMGTPMPASAGAFHSGGAGSGVLVDPGLLQQLMSSMAQIQSQPAPQAHQIEDLKAWTSQQASAVSKQTEGTLEAGTVSLVAMLFEYILDDESLSAHMKQLLARMQIPIIKVAILDKDFFTNTEHSARILLNRMARSASGWRPDANIENDSLLDGMEDIVSQLNKDFESDLTIFDRLLDEFETLLADYQNEKSSQIEIIKEEETLAFEVHQEQDRARLFIDTLLENEQLPETLEKLLSEHWYRLMRGIFNKQGESKAWQTSGRIARELVWTLQPSVQMTQAARFKKVTPKLLEGVANGLKVSGLSEQEIQDTLEQIENYHGLYEKPLNEEIWDAQEKLDQFEAQSDKAVDIIDAAAPLPINEPVVQIKNADLSYYMDQVESLATDQWFDIEQADGSFERGCLTLIIGEGQKYVFTDYQGEKLAERSAIGLAMSMRNDQFVMLTEDPLFDRMIDTLVDDLGTQPTKH